MNIEIYFDNIIFSLQKAGGISVVWFEILKRALNDTDLKLHFLDNHSINIFREQLNIKKNQKLKSNFQNYPTPIQRYINPRLQVDKGIFHSSYYRISNNHKLKNITTVHDFTYEFYRKGLAKIIHTGQKGNAIKKSSRIICVSENTKKDLLQFYPSVNEQKIHVIYNGVDESYSMLSRDSDAQLKKLIPFSSGEYAIYVGDRRSNHKNFDIAVKACSDAKLPLVMIGGGDITKTEYGFLSKYLIRTNFAQVGNISNEDLNILYNHALCLLYPSSYEGFGIPVVEAQKAGCPVICSNYSSIPEVAGEGALLLDRITPGKVSEGIKYLLQTDKNKEELVQKGLYNASRFSWDRCYGETKQLYTEIYKKKL